MPTWDQATIPALTKYLNASHKAAQIVRADLLTNAHTAGELIACAYSFAGSPDAVANSRGAEMLRCAQTVADLLDQIRQQVVKASRITQAAVAALDEADAQRKTARAKLGS